MNCLIIGDIMLDHYIYGICNRISPEAPVPVVEFKNELFTLGGAGNVLQNVIALSGTVKIISIVGNDKEAEIILEELRQMQVANKDIIKDVNRCTTIKSRIVSVNHQLIRLDKEHTKSISEDIEAKILVKLKDQIKNVDIVLLSDYNKGLLSNNLLKQIFEICNRVNVKTLLDPKGLDFSKYKGVYLVKPNKKEATIATGITIHDESSLKAACVKIQTITNCEHVIITMSEEGMAFYSDNELQIIPTKAIDVIDVTGAGDTVLAALGIALAENKSLKEACEFANHAAAIVVSKVGSATASLSEINERFPSITN